MSVPVFLHILSTGEVWASNNINDVPAGTILATAKFNSDLKFQKVCTISGNSGSYSVSGHNGKSGVEKT